MAANSRSNNSTRAAAASPVVKPTLLIVGAQKGGVGKTTVARLLLHWLEENRRAHIAFDTETPLGSLIRFHDDKTELADITEVAAQMRIFDAVAGDRSGATFIVDLRAGHLYAMLDLLTDLRILRDAQEGAFDVVFLHIMGGSTNRSARSAKRSTASPAPSTSSSPIPATAPTSRTGRPRRCARISGATAAWRSTSPR